MEDELLSLSQMGRRFVFFPSVCFFLNSLFVDLVILDLMLCQLHQLMSAGLKFRRGNSTSPPN